MTLNGVDISHWQPDDVLTQIGDYDFALIKATEGTSYVSPSCDAQVQSARKAGKLYGIYHFADGVDADAEATFFVNNIQGYLGEGVLVLDFEANALAKGAPWALEFLNKVKALTGITPWIYGSRGNICKDDYATVAANYPLWVAAYPASPPNKFTPGEAYGEVSPWHSPVAFQYSSSGRLGKYKADIDLDVFFGTADDWKKYAAKPEAGKPTPPPVTNPAPPAPAPAAAETYTVVKGDTLSAIASAHGTTWQKLAQINNLKNPNLIVPGQVLRLTTSAPAPSAKTYTVVKNDNLSAIAKKYGTTWQVLAQLNKLQNPNLIKPGQVLKLP